MLKKLIGAAYLLTTSSLTFATGISTMIGDASLSDVNTNWDPAFADGNTAVVGVDNITTLTANSSVTIGAILLDYNLPRLNIPSGSAFKIIIGSIAGKAQLGHLIY